MATKRSRRGNDSAQPGAGAQPGEGEDHGTPGRSVTRRAIIRVGLLAGAAGLTARGGPAWVPLGKSSVLAAPPVLLTRREDQLALRFEFVNLVLRKVGEPGPGDPNTARLVREVSGQPAYVIVHFGPQALGEYAYDESNNPTYGTPVKAVVSGPSRLAFVVPMATNVIPYTLGDLLAWHKLSQSVVPTAVQTVQGHPVPVAPLVTQTAIEVPWRVLLSPHDGAGWAHAVALSQVTHGGRTELWHTRLGKRIPGGVDESAARTVRAVWTPGFNRAVPPAGPDPDPPGSTSMTSLNRWEAVRLSSDWAIINRGEPYVPEPLSVDRLVLSSHGASLHADGNWPGVHDDQQGYTFALRSWVHRADLGRDSFVQIVEGGFLCGLGHRAATVTVVERKFKTISEPGHPQFGKPVAVLTKRRFIGTGSFAVELGQGSLTLGAASSTQIVMGSTKVVAVRDTSLTANVPVTIKVTPSSATQDAELFIVNSVAGSPSTFIRARGAALKSASAKGPGGVETITFTPTTSGWYGVVLVNKAGSGTYTLARL